jgi:CubicO group peptidase (beta-lactamase class C family)
MEKAGVTGLSVAILNGGRIVYARQFGWKDKDSGTRLNDSTVFAAGSLGKPVFAYLVLVLAGEGLLDLDQPLQHYLPRPLPAYPGYADLVTDPRYQAITARMVLSHTTGLPNWRTGPLTIGFTPGSRFSYSGEGFQLLQMVVEQIAHSDLETLARDKVFIPFGMAHTSYLWQPASAADVASPHNEFGWASEPDRPSLPEAAGSLMTTADDYARFVDGLLALEGPKRKIVDEMLTPAVRIASPAMIGGGDSAAGRPDTAIHLSWGLGWGLFDTPDGPAFFHTGHKSGAQNYVVVYRKTGIGIVMFSNSDNFESVAPQIAAAGIGDGFSPYAWLGYHPYDPAQRKPAPVRLVAIHLPPEAIAPYAGKYRFAGLNGSTFIKAEGDRLYASDDGQSWDELLAQSKTMFFFKGRTVTITFVTTASGKVTQMEVDNGGAKLLANRVR